MEPLPEGVRLPPLFPRTRLGLQYESVLYPWLREVKDEWKSNSVTLSTCLTLLEQYVSHEVPVPRDIQMVAMSCFYIAQSLVEVVDLNVYECVEMTAHTYTPIEFVDCIYKVVTVLGYRCCPGSIIDSRRVES